MSVWPAGMKVGPIREWPGELTDAWRRKASPFASTLSATLKLLDREVWNLADTGAQQQSAEVLVAIPVGAFTKDGRPYANARAEHPGVIFSMDTRHGHVSYPCDTFTEWQDNLRAVALALEALRKVDRYGVTKRGEQYRGFMALEQGSGESSVEAAIAVIAAASDSYDQHVVENNLSAYLRIAKRRSHPDTGGAADLWNEVAAAERTLRDAGLL